MALLELGEPKRPAACTAELIHELIHSASVHLLPPPPFPELKRNFLICLSSSHAGKQRTMLQKKSAVSKIPKSLGTSTAERSVNVS